MYGLAARPDLWDRIVEGMGILAFTMIGMAAPSFGFAGTYEASYVGGLHLVL